MKKHLRTLAMAASILGACGCAAKDDAAAYAAKPEVEPGKILIAYYSWGGNTKATAEQIQKAIGGDLFEIVPAKAYPTDYGACVDQAKQEIRQGARPELAKKLEDASKYEVVFVGSPNWWGTMAPPVATFLASNDWTGKTLVPFFTHGGGGVQNCERDVRKMCPGVPMRKAGVFSGSRAKSGSAGIADWAKESVTVK